MVTGTNVLPRNILVNTNLGTYLDLKRIWNPINLQGQGHRVKFLGEGIRHALRCPCSSLFYDVFYEFLRKIPFRKRDSHYLNKTREFHNCNFFIFHPNFMWLVAKCSSLWGHWIFFLINFISKSALCSKNFAYLEGIYKKKFHPILSWIYYIESIYLQYSSISYCFWD
jgi:hypothetical protein